MTINNCQDFHGFLNGLDIVRAGKIAEAMTTRASEPVGEYTTIYETTEEIIRRGGTFLTGREAKPLAPWEIKHMDVYFARYKYLPDEPRPENPDWGDYQWQALDTLQYIYGTYLEKKIRDGSVAIDLYDLD